MEDGVKLHKLPLWQQIKDVLFVDEKERFVLAIIRGDFDVNEVKLKNLIGAVDLRHATDEEIREKINSEPGFISPVGIKNNLSNKIELLVVADDSLRTIANAYGGSNKKNKDLLNVNIDRDYNPDIEGDIALAKKGCESRGGNGKLIEKQGIEVGNIFQLGYHYSNKMKGAEYIDADGKEKPYYMGCYGIGIGRTMATIVEKHNNEKGIIWPEGIAPFNVHLLGLSLEKPEVEKLAQEAYFALQNAGIEVLYDDRKSVMAGEKFSDADLIGIPWRAVVSERTKGKIEVKRRNEEKTDLVDAEDLIKLVKK
jgi:prolyl-tRNA synthetase